jgi:hypothetical protein
LIFGRPDQIQRPGTNHSRGKQTSECGRMINDRQARSNLPRLNPMHPLPIGRLGPIYETVPGGSNPGRCAGDQRPARPRSQPAQPAHTRRRARWWFTGAHGFWPPRAPKL